MPAKTLLIKAKPLSFQGKRLRSLGEIPVSPVSSVGPAGIEPATV